MGDFKDLLNRIANRFDSRDAFAKALGINSSRLSRALNTGDFPFNVVNCLRLAKISGESPSEVLRAAGKGDVATLIESLYGKDRTKMLSTGEREVLDRVNGLSDADLELLMRVLDRFFGTAKAARQRRKIS